jgi:hypothetical protein
MRMLMSRASWLLAGGLTLLATLALSTQLEAAAKKEKKTSKAAMKVIASVNGDEVTKGDYDAAIKGNRRFFDLTQDSVRRKLGGRPWTEYVFKEEIVKIRAFSQRHAAELPEMLAAIEAAQREIEGGADFAQVAKEHSREPMTAEKGGDLGEPKAFFDLVHPFNRVALSLKQGAVSEPVLTVFGYHLIKVDKIFPAMEGKPKLVKIRHILMPFQGDPRQEADEALAQAEVEILVKSYCKKLPTYCEEG